MKRFQTALRILIRTFLKLFPSWNIIYRTPHGFSINLDLTKQVDYEYYYGHFENDTLATFESFLKPGMTVLDIGANIGIYALIAASKVGCQGSVYSFEPGDWACARLKANVEANRYAQVKVSRQAVSDKTGKAMLSVCKDDAFNSLGCKPMQKVHKVIEIETTTIDDFVQANNLSKVDIIKVDTEGAEYRVFIGGAKTIREHSPVIFFEYNPYACEGFDYGPEESIKYLRTLGYKMYEFVDKKLTEIQESSVKTFDIIAMK